jgi:arylsulfatase A-like enzyme
MRFIHRVPELIRCLLWGAVIAAVLAWVDVMVLSRGAQPSMDWWERAQLVTRSAEYLLAAIEGSFIFWWSLSLAVSGRRRLDGREDDMGRKPARLLPMAAFWTLVILILARVDYSEPWVWKAVLWGLLGFVLMSWLTAPRRRFDDTPGRPMGELQLLAIAAVSALLIWAPTWSLSGLDPRESSPEAIESSASPEQPNFVLVVIDTLRADHLGSYGYARPTTPAMDKLAARGVRFDQAISASSWTLPAMASIFTSNYPATHGADREKARLPRDLDDLATQLTEAGYRTAGFSTNPWLNRVFGFDDGFLSYHDNARLTIGRETAGVRFKNLLMRWLGKIRRDPEEFPSASEVTDWGERWLRGNSGEPFFLYLHYMDVHHPYLPDKEHAGIFCKKHRFDLPDHELEHRFRMKEIEWSPDLVDHMIERYDEELVATDQAIGRLTDILKELGLDDTTALIITSDHGEEFLDHGGAGHRRTVYEEVVRVPLIIVPPGATGDEDDEGHVIRERVSTLDIMPTLIQWGGGVLPLSVDGESLREFLFPLRDEEEEESSTAKATDELPRALGSQLFYEDRAWTALYLEEDKLIRITPPPTDPAASTRLELYHLVQDPGERVNAAKLEPERIDVLLALMAAMEPQWGVPGARPLSQGEPIDDETLDKLRGLGYIK